MQKETLYTVGHSNRTLESFLELLAHYGIKELIDIRTLPGSRKYPSKSDIREHVLKDGTRMKLPAISLLASVSFHFAQLYIKNTET